MTVNLTAQQVADLYGMRREWVYDHAADLGAVRMGTGPRPRLRFDPDVVAEKLAAMQEPAPAPPSPPAPRRGRPRKVSGPDPHDLLPIRGR